MARRRKRSSCFGTLLTIPFIIVYDLLNSAMHYKPTPLIGGRPGRKKKKWL